MSLRIFSKSYSSKLRRSYLVRSQDKNERTVDNMSDTALFTAFYYILTIFQTAKLEEKKM